MSTKKAMKGAAAAGAEELAALHADLERERAQRSTQQAALAAMQAQLEALMRQAPQVAPAVSSASAGASASALQPLVAPTPVVRRAAVQTEQLVYERASQPDVLDNWLFKLEQLFTQLGMPESDVAGRVREAALTWDLATDRWWRAHTAQLQARGAPVATWAAFVDALHAHFVPVKDAEAATEELLRVRQRGSETMDAYLLRAAQLLVRSRGAVQDETAAQLVVTNADKMRFPFALAAVRKAMRASRTPLSFAAVRALLAEAALDEPGVRASPAAAPGPAGHTGSSSHGSGGSAGHAASRTRH